MAIVMNETVDDLRRLEAGVQIVSNATPFAPFQSHEAVASTIHSLPAKYDDVDSWFLMSRPWPMLAITACYLLFVLRVGPSLMRLRPPLSLRNVLMLYNAAMVAFSVWWIIKVFIELSVSSKVSCLAQSLQNDQENHYINSLAWYYLMSKFVELLDTVFFVLRKKQSQVSFLHVYHHTNMAVFTWATLKYVRGDQILMIGMVNSGVHAIMYSYYLLASMGPAFQRFLWFKPYITLVQLGQFVFLIGYLVYLLALNCDGPRKFIQFAVVNTFSFLVLFMHFYRQTYSKRKLKPQ